MSIKAHVNRDYKDALTGASYMFFGLNNVLDPYNLPIEKGWVPRAENVDIDNTNSISRRVGYTSKISTTSAHSGWSNNVDAYYVDDAFLKSFNDNTSSTIDILTSSARMWYVQANDVVVYSNGTDSGMIGGTFTQTATYSPDFKISTSLGTNLEFYNGRVYHAKNNSVYCTDIFDIEHSDVRHQHVATFKDKVTMIRRVEDGLYIGTLGWTYFLAGNDIIEGGFEQQTIADYGVILGTDVSSTGDFFPESKARNQIVIWTSTRGICTGGASANFINHSIGIVSIPEVNQGAGLLRDINGIRQYIVTLIGDPTEYNPYPDIAFDTNIVAV